ncbi:MAG: ABC transporter ATP-binding protein [Actinomycetota bacterium]|nr:ABC transporter ATP-binding protein [Actinomycetota bacterium]
MAEKVIEVEGLVKRYDERVAVAGIDFSVSPGEIFGVLGPNGAGKTTTILMLLGLTEPSEGSVRVCGLDPARDAIGVKRRVGYLPDAVGFYEDLTGRQNMRYTARLNELDPSEAEDRIDELLEEVGLSESADYLVGTYSRGMRQRLGVADILVKDPDVVILDEPTTAIDPEGVVEILALISRLAHTEGRAVLISSHLLNQVQQVCDRVGIFVEGEIVAQGTPDELAASLSEDSSVYEFVVDATEEQVRTAIASGLPGLGDKVVVTSTGPGRWRVVLPERDISGVVRALVEAGLSVRQIRDLGSNLDEIYRRYFHEHEGVSA